MRFSRRMPYRSTKRRGSERPAPEPGLVTEMVRQFADRYAFLRELVQNSIDAGTTRIDVRVRRSADGAVETSVSDDGCGMTPEVIEGALLTLFSSTKEDDASKVGKYGVGFVSVFAIEPRAVLVETWRDGGRWRLSLRSDHSYELEALGDAEGSGTRVALASVMDAGAFEEHVRRCRAALERWCRHVAVPITLSWLDESALGLAGEGRIDRPLAVDAVVSLRATLDAATIVIGCAAPGVEPRSFAGFYNRGLTLHTQTEALPGLEGLRFKIDSPELAHTLSRDNVRRDGRFAHALEQLRRLAQGPLRARAAEALARAAASVVEGGAPGHYAALLETARWPPLSLDRGELAFPLTDPIDDLSVLSGDEIARRTPFRAPVLFATGRDELTTALARTGRPVVWCSTPEVASEVAEVFDVRTFFGPNGTCRAHELYVSMEERRGLGAVAARLAAELERVLEASGNAVGRVAYARFCGAPLRRTAVVVGADHGRLARADELAAARRLGRSRVMLLDVSASAVVAARSAARRDVATAAQLLARIVLLELSGAASRRENLALLAAYAEGGR